MPDARGALHPARGSAGMKPEKDIKNAVSGFRHGFFLYLEKVVRFSSINVIR